MRYDAEEGDLDTGPFDSPFWLSVCLVKGSSDLFLLTTLVSSTSQKFLIRATLTCGTAAPRICRCLCGHEGNRAMISGHERSQVPQAGPLARVLKNGAGEKI